MLQNNTKTQQVQTHMYQSKVPQARQVRQKWSWAVQLSLGRALLASAQQSLRVLGPECNPYFCDYDCEDKVMRLSIVLFVLSSCRNLWQTTSAQSCSSCNTTSTLPSDLCFSAAGGTLESTLEGRKCSALLLCARGRQGRRGCSGLPPSREAFQPNSSQGLACSTRPKGKCIFR
jgi:hypothetical protein